MKWLTFNRRLYNFINSPSRLMKHNIRLRCNSYCTEVLEKSQTVPKKANNKRKINVNNAVHNYMSASDDLKKNIQFVPKCYIRTCISSPPYLYFVSDQTAERFVNLVGNKLKKTCPIVEVNPGFGCLTKKLLDYGVEKLFLYESSPHYRDSIEELQKQYPDRIDYRKDDFLGMYKLLFNDTFDSGNRFETLMEGLNIKEDSTDTSIQILGVMSCTKFLRSMLYSFLFSEGVLGKAELLVVTLPSAIYSLIPAPFKTDSSEGNQQPGVFILNNSLPTLFQLLFECEVLETFPRKYFLPWQVDFSKKLKRNTYRKKIMEMDNEEMILMSIKFKENLPCKYSDLPLLWFFLKQHLGNQKTKIIPCLEKWIPGCGIWLITEQDPPNTDTSLSPSQHDEPLPHMTIFTKFSDLTPGQKLTLFKKFISWPDFKNSPFKEEMEHYRGRMLTDSDLNVKYDSLDLDEKEQDIIINDEE